jgi:tRNA A-37 threonylcarbamoyl transferase component Bud32
VPRLLECPPSDRDEHITVAANFVLDEFLWRSGLAERDEHGDWTALTGGVSSDIWRVHVNGADLCVKRALGKLKVSADWFASPKRNAYEWAWLNFAARHLPLTVPTPLAHDPAAGILAMRYLPSDNYPVWKDKLLGGDVNIGFAGEVGRLLGRLHSISARDPSLIDQLGDTESFEAIRLDPYFLTTAARHPRLAQYMQDLVDRTKSLRIAAVHGDVSPKNILMGPQGPVFLDAEAAWYGDPAFDVAFGLNHLLLKCLARPLYRLHYLHSFTALWTAYSAQIDWEPRELLEQRVARLLPALLLARVDGKSPVEYLTSEEDRLFVRRTAIEWMRTPPASVADFACRWEKSTGLKPDKKHVLTKRTHE